MQCTTNCQLKRLKVQSRGGQGAWQGADDLAHSVPSPTTVGTQWWGENTVQIRKPMGPSEQCLRFWGMGTAGRWVSYRVTFLSQNSGFVHMKCSHQERRRRTKLIIRIRLLSGNSTSFPSMFHTDFFFKKKKKPEGSKNTNSSLPDQSVQLVLKGQRRAHFSFQQQSQQQEKAPVN